MLDILPGEIFYQIAAFVTVLIFDIPALLQSYLASCHRTVCMLSAGYLADFTRS